MPRTIFECIESLGARAVVPGRDFKVSPRGDVWDFDCGDFHLRDLPSPALSGRQQTGNAATALAALVEAGFAAELTQRVVASALRETHIRGRFQVHRGDVEWVLDVAHNVPAAEGLRDNLAALPRRRTLAVCGVLGDKDIAGITEILAPTFDAWVLAASTARVPFRPTN